MEILGAGDEEALEAFLRLHVSTSLLLLSNMRKGGLVDRGQYLQGTYAVDRRPEGIQGVVAHCWNGNLLLQAPEGAGALARQAALASGRAVRGVLGPWDQVEDVLAGLGLSGVTTLTKACEDLFSVSLASLAIPDALTNGQIVVRRPDQDELSLLGRWRHDFNVESIHESAGADLLARSEADAGASAASGALFVAKTAGRLVSMASLNARALGCAQVGGVWTPPTDRSRGYGRAVVCGALLQARSEGVSTGVLFTAPENRPAQRAYEALGFRRIGHYGLVLFERGHRIAP
jgi:ribosomal protein S18 acetylase RimI-like enzyme